MDKHEFDNRTQDESKKEMHMKQVPGKMQSSKCKKTSADKRHVGRNSIKIGFRRTRRGINNAVYIGGLETKEFYIQIGDILDIDHA